MNRKLKLTEKSPVKNPVGDVLAAVNLERKVRVWARRKVTSSSNRRSREATASHSSKSLTSKHYE